MAIKIMTTPIEACPKSIFIFLFMFPMTKGPIKDPINPQTPRTTVPLMGVRGKQPSGVFSQLGLLNFSIMVLEYILIAFKPVF